jgi:6-phosphofructokinase 1
LTLIPEEFSRDNIALDEVARLLEGAILKRRVMGQKHGLAVIAEGIGAKLDPAELAQLPGVAVDYDPYGHIRLGEIPLATILRRGVQRRFSARDEQIAIVEATLGYELRSAQPIPYDMDYTRTLGYGAVRFLLSEPREERLKLGGMVCLDQGHLHALAFGDLRDPETGRTRVRLVDINSEHYISTRQYMIRLEPRNLTNPEMRARLAEAANMTPGDFGKAFASAVGLTEQGAVG